MEVNTVHRSGRVVLEDKEQGRSKAAREPAAGFFRARSFREVEILVSRIRLVTIMIGIIGTGLVVWYLAKSGSPAASIARPDPHVPRFEHQVTAHSDELARIGAASGASASAASTAGETTLAEEYEPTPDVPSDNVDD